MKLSKVEVGKREAFLRELFAKEPTITGSAANDRLAAAFPNPDQSPGRKMRAARLYKIRREVTKPPAEPVVEATPASAA